MNFYEKTSDDTLEQLCEVFDFLLEDLYPSDFDVSLAVSFKFVYYVARIIINSFLTFFFNLEWSTNNSIKRPWNLRNQQTNTQQTDLAFISF